MRRLAKILLAGTAVATAASAVANAQAQAGSGAPAKGEVVNEQVLLGDVFAGQRLHVIDPADGVQAEGVASGNAFSVGVQGRAVDIDSHQTVDADATARTDVEIHGWTPTTVASSAATGNAGEAWATDGGVIDTIATQVVSDGSVIKAETKVRAELSSSGDTDASSQALGNSHSYAVGSGAYSTSETLQRQHGSVTASTDAALFHVKGTATLDATAASNDITHTGDGASGYVGAHQHATGQTIASTVGNVRSGYLVDATSHASGNSIEMLSRSLEATVDARQKQEGYVRAETYLYVQDFGAMSASASGVGNSIIAENSGESLDIYSDQENDGQVDVEAALFGGDGYDASVSAEAYGNTVYGSICYDCDGQLNVDNRQVNTAGVTATARTSIGGSARTVQSNARAVGNNAAYYTITPRN